MNEGGRRLSLVLGLLGLLPWAVTFTIWFSANTGKLWPRSPEAIMADDRHDIPTETVLKIQENRMKRDGVPELTEEQLELAGAIVEEGKKKKREDLVESISSHRPVLRPFSYPLCSPQPQPVP